MKLPSNPIRTFAFPKDAARAALAVTLLLGALPAPAGARTDTPAAAPIVVDRCTVDEATSIQNPKIGVHPSTVDGFVISYRNASDVGATEVRFRVRYGGKPLDFVDRGSFAAHAKASREFSNFSLVYTGSNVDCSVTSATFTDGTRWDAPDAMPSPAATR